MIAQLSSNVVKADGYILEQNVKTRNHMEDFVSSRLNFMNDQSKAVYVLCDGHCGDKVAEIVCNKLPDVFEACLREHNFNVEKAINESFRKMDEELEEYEEEGSTGCLIYICIENGERVVYSANIGDSRNILVRETESIRLSFDHKANVKSEIERVKSEGGIIIKGRLYATLAITRAFGDYSFKIDVSGLSNIPYITRTVVLNSDKYVVMASDGIWDVINEEKATDIINNCNYTDCKELALQFVNKSLDLGSKDNISCIVIKLN